MKHLSISFNLYYVLAAAVRRLYPNENGETIGGALWTGWTERKIGMEEEKAEGK